MDVCGVLEVIRRKYQSRRDGMDDEGWKTIRGTHVMVGEGGDITHGPDALRGWNSARQAKAKQSAAKQARPRKRAVDCKDGGELAKHMEREYRARISPKMEKWMKDKTHFSSVQSIVRGLEDVVEEIPELKQQLKGLELGNTGVLGCDGKTITFDVKDVGDYNKLVETCKQQAKAHHWPNNSSPQGLIVHECGHILEQVLINKEIKDPMERIEAWNKSRIATQIVGEAAKKIKATEFGKGKKIADLQREISLYASKNKSETLAEAFADCYDNGENANPFSKAIKEEALRRLRA